MNGGVEVSPVAAAVLLVLFGGVGGYAAVFLVSTLLAMLGFTAIGVSGGSYAAGWQATIGNVAAGSWFASLTSVAMSGSSSVVFIPAVLVSVVKPLIDLINGVEPGSYTGILLQQILNLVVMTGNYSSAAISNVSGWWWS